MLVLGVLIGLILLLSVLYKVKYSRRNILLSKIPSPNKMFLLHNSSKLAGKSSLIALFKLIEEWHHELGDVFQITLHPFDCGTIIVSDAKIAEALSNHQPDRSRCRSYEGLSRWIGVNGLFLSSGRQLKQRMKPLANVLNPKFIQLVSAGIDRNFKIST